MTRQLCIVTGCSAGVTESFVIVPPELVKIKYIHSFLFAPPCSQIWRRWAIIGPWRARTMALSMSCGRCSARRAYLGCMPVWRQRFGGTWTCHDVGAGEVLLRPLGFGIGIFSGTAATSELSSKSRRCFQIGGLLPCSLTRHLCRQLNDHQTPQGQNLNNFISGSAGGLVGTVLNTPYVMPITPSYGDASSLLSWLPVSTSAAQFFVRTVAFQTDSLHTGCQVSDPEGREVSGVVPKYNWTCPAYASFLSTYLVMVVTLRSSLDL
jgi:hypothetical protein